MDLAAPDQPFSLDNQRWPIRGEVSAVRVPSDSVEQAPEEARSIISPGAEHVFSPDRATVGAGVTIDSAGTTVTRRGIVVVRNRGSTPTMCDDMIGMYYRG